MSKTKEKINYLYRKIFLNSIKYNKLLNEIKENESKRIINFDIPEHGNIGDHAIAIAEKNFINKHFPNHQYIEIPSSISSKSVTLISKNIRATDILIFHGGGNFGNLYSHHENLRRKIVNNLQNNIFIQFPQSIYYSIDEKGQKELKKSIEIFSGNQNFILFAREGLSFEKMKKYFPANTSKLIPDIVFSLPKFESNSDRSGAITLLRDDIEASIDKEIRNSTYDILKDYFGNIHHSDTHIGEGKYIEIEHREEIVKRKWEEISKYKIVVTDRLHGMIFAYITKTPCLVFDNNNHKVKETYNQWLFDCDYIELIENLNEDTIRDSIMKLQNVQNYQHDLSDKYSVLIDYIK